MKKVLFLSLFAFWSFVIISCSSKSPSTPAKDTPTPVPPTVTSTPSATPSPTSGSPTASFTPTGTPTNSPTFCSTVVFQTTYTFASSTDCWHPDIYGGSANVVVTGEGISTTQVHTGSTGSLQLAVTANSSSAGQLQFEVTLPVDQDFNGGTIDAYIYCDASLGNTGAMLFDQSVTAVGGSSATYPMETAWTNITGGSWIKMTQLVSGSGTVNTHHVSQFGVQIPGITAGHAGNVYLDNVVLTIPVGNTPTPTYTPTPVTNGSYTWEDNNVDYWSVWNPGSNYTLAVTSITGLGTTATAGDGSNYGLDATLALAGGNDLQLAVNGGNGTTYTNFPMNWTSLGATGVRCQVYVPAGTFNGGNETWVVGGLFVQAGSPVTNMYGTCYTGSATDNDPVQLTNTGGWQSLSFEPTGGSWSSDKTAVDGVGIDFNLGSTQGATSEFIVDNYVIY